MDKISKALELSRRSRAANRRSYTAPAPEEISYTRTRTVELDRSYLARQGIIEGLSDRSVVDAYKLLRTRTMQRMRQNDWKTLGITSARENEGKSVTAINLAISIAKKFEHTVVLVDGDLRRPSVHRLMGFNPEAGLSDVLRHDTLVEDVLIHPDVHSLVVIPGREAVEGSSEYLASPKMGALIQELRNRYPSRYVIVDLPPVLMADDVVAFSPLLDAVMVVVEDEKTSTLELQRTMELLEGVDIVGTVLNKSKDANEESYYY